MQERENCSVADTTFLDSGLNFSLTSVCVGIGLAYCFMFILLVAKAFLRPDGDSCGQTEFKKERKKKEVEFNCFFVYCFETFIKCWERVKLMAHHSVRFI